MTPSKAQRRVLLKHKIEIDAQFRKTHRLQNRSEFRYYYNDANTILSDFKNYLIVQLSHNKKNSDQYANNVRQVWASVDPNRQIFPKNILQDPDAIEDYFYQPLYVSLKQLEITERGRKSPCTSRYHKVKVMLYECSPEISTKPRNIHQSKSR